jgi:hypothetical protein
MRELHTLFVFLFLSSPLRTLSLSLLHTHTHTFSLLVSLASLDHTFVLGRRPANTQSFSYPPNRSIIPA